jgi:drug/metabolite transporter (DMT)-like permease
VDVALALAAALFFAGGTVLQGRVAATASDDEALKAGFLLRLARRPQWLAGIALDGLGFVCQAIALAVGRLVVVQPLLAASVVFALPLGARLDHKRVGRRELVAAVAVTAGLGAFLIAGDPTGGREDATATAWIASFAIAGALCAALVLAARGAPPARKAAMIGTAAGILFGLSAALTKAVVEQLDEGVLEIFDDWRLYALIVVGYTSMTLSQASLQTGALGAAVSTQMALDPVASVLLGTLAFDEEIHDSALGIAAALVALAVMLAGLVVLAAAEQEGGQASSGESSAKRSVV